MAKCGRKTEKYSRVTGYFRPVCQWNKGKKEEFKDRLNFKVPAGTPGTTRSVSTASTRLAPEAVGTAGRSRSRIAASR